MKQYLNQEYSLNIIVAFFGFARRTFKPSVRRICLFGLLTMFAVALPFAAFSVEQSALNNFTLKGQVRLSSGAETSPVGLDVVLLKYVLSPEGEVSPVGPQARVKTNIGGNFEFVKVKRDLRAGYQLGTRVEGVLYSSKIFFMKAGETLIEKDIIIPGISNAVEELEASQVSLVIESGLGAVTVTEVLVFSNSTPDRIDTNTRPLVQKLPAGIENFRMMDSKSVNSMEHKLEENVLKIAYIFPTGSTQIIYQYILPAWFGGLEINREFEHSLDIVGVFTPIERLHIKSDELSFSGKQSLNDTTFLTWKSKASDSNRLNFKISNVPTTSLQYAGVSVIILVLLFGTVVLFYRQRLTKINRNKMAL
jgi:hypothetical protein